MAARLDLMKQRQTSDRWWMLNTCLSVVAIVLAVVALALGTSSTPTANPSATPLPVVSSESGASSEELARNLSAAVVELAALRAENADILSRVALLEATGSPTTVVPTAEPTATPSTVPTAVPSSSPSSRVVYSGNLDIRDSSNPAVLESADYNSITETTGYLTIFNNDAVTSLADAFSNLKRVEGTLNVEGNEILTSFATAFSNLVRIMPHGVNGISLQIFDNPALTTLGTAFRSLRRVAGTLLIDNNPRLTDFEALRNLTCHGGAYQNNPSQHCQNCPNWLLDLPTCECLDDPQHSSTCPTAAPSSNPTAWTEVIHLGNVDIQNSNDPAALETEYYDSITNVTGFLQIAFNSGFRSMDGTFQNLKRTGGYFSIGYNQGLASTGDAFPRLEQIEGYLNIENNDNLTSLDTAFFDLVQIGTVANPGNHGISLYIVSNRLLTTLGTAFRSLRRIDGTLEIHSNPLLTDFEALRNLICHGGVYESDPSRDCQNCPSWLLDKPRC